MTTEPARFETHRAMLLAGIRRHHAFADVPRDVPAQWREFNEMVGTIPGTVGHTSYGVICGADMSRNTMEYMCAIEVASFDAVPAGVGRLRVPPDVLYAVFVHDGPIDGIRATWDAVWRWLPGSGYRSANTPDWERYDERYDPATGTGVVEIWVPVEKADA